MGLTVIPITFRQMKEFVSTHHRHHVPPQGHKFSVGVVDHDGKLVGVGSGGRPVSRHMDDGLTLEITRVASDGTPNVCSKIYGSLRKCGVHMGYRRFITYTLEEESGVSLRGSGWIEDGTVKGETWNKPNRKRVDKHPTSDKTRWVWYPTKQP